MRHGASGPQPQRAGAKTARGGGGHARRAPLLPHARAWPRPLRGGGGHNIITPALSSSLSPHPSPHPAPHPAPPLPICPIPRAPTDADSTPHDHRALVEARLRRRGAETHQSEGTVADRPLHLLAPQSGVRRQGRVVIDSKHWTDFCSDEPSLRVCIKNCIHHEGKSCGLVRSRFECLLSMAL